VRDNIRKEVRKLNFKLGFSKESPDAEGVMEKHIYEEKIKKYFNETIPLNRNIILRQQEMRRKSTNIQLGVTANNADTLKIINKSLMIDANRRSRQHGNNKFNKTQDNQIESMRILQEPPGFMNQSVLDLN
jgi:hypothetical protein